MLGKDSWKKFLALFILLVIASGTLICSGNSIYKAGLWFGLINFIVSAGWIAYLYNLWRDK